MNLVFVIQILQMKRFIAFLRQHLLVEHLLTIWTEIELFKTLRLLDETQLSCVSGNSLKQIRIRILR